MSKRKDFGETGRFRKSHIREIKERGYKLDVTWLMDDSLEDADELPEPQDFAAEAIPQMEAVVDDLGEIVEWWKGRRRGELREGEFRHGLRGLHGWDAVSKVPHARPKTADRFVGGKDD